MKTKKFGIVLALIASLAFSLPVQAAGMSTVSGGDVSLDTISGGDLPVVDESTVTSGDTISGGDISEDVPTVSDGDAGEDLSGKTVNLSLIVDITGSMSGYINGVIENLSGFVRYIESTGVTFRLSLIDYRDITCGEETYVHTFDHSVWCKNADQMIAELESLSVYGGGDYEETVIDALGYLVDESVMTFNSDAAKFAIVLTDAPYKTENIHGITDMSEMIAALKEKGIRVSVMTEEGCYDDYEELTSSTGGILCPVYDFSETLKEYAASIIKATADSEIDTSIVPVAGINAEGPATVHPDYVYSYCVTFTPENATNKGLFWYTEDSEIAEVISASSTTCYVRGIAEGNTKLIAVSSDGGYTSTLDITVSNSAAVSDTVLAYEYAAIKDALYKDEVTTLEYRITDGTSITDEQQKEVFSAIQGKNKTFSFAFADGEKSLMYKWSFMGSKITNPEIAIDFNTVVNAGNLEVLDAVKEDVAKTDIHFEHNGSLPGEASVTVSVKDLFSTDSLYLYYYNPLNSTLELEAEGIAIVDGYATFPLTHCSDYVLTVEMLRSLIPDLDDNVSDNVSDDTSSNTSGNISDNISNNTSDDAGVQEEKTAVSVEESALVSPKTGESGVMGCAFIAVIAAIGSLICGKKVYHYSKRK